MPIEIEIHSSLRDREAIKKLAFAIGELKTAYFWKSQIEPWGPNACMLSFVCKYEQDLSHKMSYFYLNADLLNLGVGDLVKQIHEMIRHSISKMRTAERFRAEVEAAAALFKEPESADHAT